MNNFYSASEDDEEKHDNGISAKYPFLFKIPNPFEEMTRDKKTWFNKIKKLEQMVKSERKKLDALTRNHMKNQQGVKVIRAYCSQLPKSRLTVHH